MGGLDIMLLALLSGVQNGTNYIDESEFGNQTGVNGTDDISNLEATRPVGDTPNQIKPMPSKIRVTAWQNMPYSGLRKNAKGEWEGMGYAFELLRLMQKELNFSYTIIPPETWILGNKDVGVMKQLHHEEVDLAVSFIPVLEEFQKICRFSVPVDEAEVTFMMKRLRESAVGSGLLAPFSTQVWLYILISLIIVGPVAYVIVYFRTKIAEEGQGEGFSLLACCWFTYGALVKQGSTITPITDSTRVVFASWWIFITILTSFYTANLTAFLTLSEYTLPYNSIQDIVKKHPKWVTFKDDLLDNTLNITEEIELLKLKGTFQKYGGFVHATTGEDKFKDFDIAKAVVRNKPQPLYLGDRHFIDDIIFHDYRNATKFHIEESKRCTLVMQPKNLFVNIRAFAFPHNTTISDHINRQLINQVETGIVDHLKKEPLPQSRYCPLDLKSTERQLQNADLKLTYYCIITGYSLSIIVFLGEMINRFVQLRKSRSDESCCTTLCCRSKAKSAELPFFKRDIQPNFLTGYDNNAFAINDSSYNGKMAEKQMVNGRDYWVIREQDGDRRLVPIRTPSALLFSSYA